MNEQRTKEDLSISLNGLSADYRIDCSIDADGDLLVERSDCTKFIYVPGDQLQQLRDWLNKVLP